jgi:hypothetical protein
LGFRWGKDMDTQVRNLAQHMNISAGELVMYLLNYALKKLKAGHWRFKEETITISQKVSPQEINVAKRDGQTW